MKEILLYGPVYDYVAQVFITNIEAASGNDITIRVNSPGGSVFAGYGMLAKMNEFGNNVNVKVDGIAASMAAFFPLYADNTVCLDVSRFMLHRADMFVETDEERALLATINKDLKAKMKARLDDAKLKELKGISIDEIFDAEQVVDVWLSAKEAKQIGLVNKVVSLKPKEMAAMDALYTKLAAFVDTDTPAPNPTQTSKNNTMTLQELKAQHADLVKAIVTETLEAERDRVGALLAYMPADPEGITAAIKEGKQLTQTMTAELGLKMLTANALDKVKKDSTGKVVTPDAETVVETKPSAAAASFEKELRDGLGLKN